MKQLVANRGFGRILLFAVVWFCFVNATFAQVAGPEREKQIEYSKDLERVRAFHKTKNFLGFKLLIEEIETKWGATNSDRYFDLMATACDMLTTVDFGDESQGPLGQNYAVLALQKSGPMPPKYEWRLVYCLRQNFEFEKGKMVGEHWSRHRSERGRIWLRVWSKLSKEMDRKFKSTDRPVAVPIPTGAGIRIGDPPGLIQNPEIRQKYIAALVEYDKKQTAYARQTELHALDKKYATAAEKFITHVYSIAPPSLTELKSLLNEFPIDANVASHIVKTVEKNLSQLAIAKNVLAAKKAQDPAMLAARFPLRMDPKLRTKVPAVGANLQLAELLESLRKATGLNMNLADNLTHHDPKFGDVRLPAASAWTVMEMIAQRDLDDGLWVKTGDGYRLEGTSRTLRPPPRRFGWAWAAGGLPLAIAAAGGAFVIYRRRGKKPTANPSKQVAQVKSPASQKKPT